MYEFWAFPLISTVHLTPHFTTGFPGNQELLVAHSETFVGLVEK